MHLCGQTILCTVSRCETASGVPSSNKFVYEIHRSGGSEEKPSLHYKAGPDPRQLWGEHYKRGHVQYLIITSSSPKMQPGC